MATRSKIKTEKRREAVKNCETVYAHANSVRISPSKVRVVMDTVRGKSVNEALAMLQATPKAASEILYKVISSACANAEHNKQLSRADLYVAELFANGGPILKRVNPVSKGRAYRINKRTSHITAGVAVMKEDN